MKAIRMIAVGVLIFGSRLDSNGARAQQPTFKRTAAIVSTDAIVDSMALV